MQRARDERALFSNTFTRRAPGVQRFGFNRPAAACPPSPPPVTATVYRGLNIPRVTGSGSTRAPAGRTRSDCVLFVSNGRNDTEICDTKIHWNRGKNFFVKLVSRDISLCNSYAVLCTPITSKVENITKYIDSSGFLV